MCKVIYIKKKIEEEKEMNFFQKRGEELGLRLMVYSAGMEIMGYNGNCFCDVKEEWRDAVSTLLKEFMEDDYYIFFRSGPNSNMTIIEGNMPQDKKDDIKKWRENVEETLLRKTAKKNIDEMDLDQIAKATEIYQDMLARYDTGTIKTVRF